MLFFNCILPLPDVSIFHNFAWLPDPCYQATLFFFFLAVLGLHCCVGFPLVVASGDFSSCGTVVPCVAEHGLEGAWASVVAAPGL